MLLVSSRCGHLDSSNQIVESAQVIDKSLAETKGARYVQRMLQTLPQLPEANMSVEETHVDDRCDEGIINICQ